MNVLFVSHYSKLYGANRSLLALLDGLDHSSITPFVVIPHRGDMVKALEKRGITYFVLPFKNWMAKSRFKMPFRLLMNLMLIPVLLWKLNKWKINLVYTNSSVTPVGAWIAFISNLPHIWHIREFGRKHYGFKYDLGEKVFNYWLNQTVKIIAVSNSIRDGILNKMKDKTVVVYNGIISRIEASKLPPISLNHSTREEQLKFGIIGFLHPSKGQENAIRAFSRIVEQNANIKLWIAGSGSKEYESYLKELSIQLNVNNNIKFLGYVDHPFQFFSNVDVVLVCSEYEAMGRVTAEAMVAGKPVIGFDNAGTSELIDDNKNGLLYNGTIDSLVSKMEFILKNDFSTIARNAREKGLNNFIIEDYATKIEQEIMAFNNI